MEITGHLAGRRFFGGALGMVWTTAEEAADLLEMIPEGVDDEVIGPA
jgi:hypothetical protein